GIDDFIDSCLVHVGVPDTLRINHQYRPLSASVQAACLVDADLALAGQSKRLDALLGIVLHGLGALPSATGTRRIGSALVQAKKDVVLVIGLHTNSQGRKKRYRDAEPTRRRARKNKAATTQITDRLCVSDSRCSQPVRATAAVISK